MARLFNDASSQYLEYPGAVINATGSFEPFTMACWFYTDDLTVDSCLMTVADNSVATEYHALAFRGTVVNDPITAQSRTSASTGNANTSVGVSANTWTHACGVWRTIADRSAYINGGGRGNNVASETAHAMNRTALGRYADSTPSGYHSGAIAEATIWNVVLSDAEIAGLAKGVPSRSVRPNTIVGYWPLWGLHSPEIDLTLNNRIMTNTGTILTTHAPVDRFTKSVGSL